LCSRLFGPHPKQSPLPLSQVLHTPSTRRLNLQRRPRQTSKIQLLALMFGTSGTSDRGRHGLCMFSRRRVRAFVQVGKRKSYMAVLKGFAGCACFLDRLTAPDFTCLFPQSHSLSASFLFLLSHSAGLETDRSDFSYFDTRRGFTVFFNPRREQKEKCKFNELHTSWCLCAVGSVA
jgi:hypothetical protein